LEKVGEKEGLQWWVTLSFDKNLWKLKRASPGGPRERNLEKGIKGGLPRDKAGILSIRRGGKRLKPGD